MRCCFCDKSLRPHECNNPEPLATDPDVCCDHCNYDKVIPARLEQITGGK